MVPEENAIISNNDLILFFKGNFVFLGGTNRGTKNEFFNGSCSQIYCSLTVSLHGSGPHSKPVRRFRITIFLHRKRSLSTSSCFKQAAAFRRLPPTLPGNTESYYRQGPYSLHRDGKGSNLDQSRRSLVEASLSMRSNTAYNLIPEGVS